jgi:predicted MFS family arabinose efflux permease
METGVDKTQRVQSIPTRVRLYLRVFAELPADALRLLFGTMSIWIGIGVFGVLFNLYLIAIGQSLAFLGLVAAVGTAGQASASPIMGWILRHFATRHVMAAGAAIMAVTMAASALLTNGAALLILTLLSGTAVSIATIPAYPLMMEQVTEQQRPHLFSAFMAASSLGSMIGSLLSGLVPSLINLLPGLHGRVIAGERVGLLVGGVLSALGIWLFWGMRGERVAEGARDRPTSPDAGYSADEADLRRDVLAMLGATGVIALSMGSIYPFFNVYLAARQHASTATIGSVYAFSGVVCTVAAFAVPLVAKVGTLRAFTTTRLLTAPMFLILALHPGLALAVVAYLGRNILGTMTGTMESSFSMEVMPPRLRATVASWRTFAFNVAWTGGSVVAGEVIARYGYERVFLSSGLLTTVGVATWYLRFGRRKSK